MEQKRHAILQNYIMMYMVLIVYHHVLHRMMLTMAFCFFQLPVLRCTSSLCSVLGSCSKYLSCNHCIKCSDCLLEIKITE